MMAALNIQAWMGFIAIALITLTVNDKWPSVSKFITDIYNSFHFPVCLNDKKLVQISSRVITTIATTFVAVVVRIGKEITQINVTVDKNVSSSWFKKSNAYKRGYYWSVRTELLV